MRLIYKVGGAFLVVFLLTFGTGPGTAIAEEEQMFTPIPVIKGIKLLDKGTPAPAFVVQDTSGKKFDFAAHQKEKAHLLIFWSIFCEPCREEMPIVEKVYNEFREKNFEVIAVNLDGDPFLESIRGFIKQYKYTFKILIDELIGDQFVVSDPYQVAGTPVLYLVDDQGLIFAGHLGRISEKDLKIMITDMLEKG